MSDDTPTQRFPNPDSGDVPTQRLDTAEITEDLHEEKQKSRGLLIGLIVAGGLLLIAVIVLVVFLVGAGAKGGDTPDPFTSDSSTPQALPTDTSTPAPTPTATPTDDAPNPPSTTPRIDSFAVSPSEWFCNSSAPVPVPDPQLTFSWTTTNATHVYFGVGSTTDAEQNGMGWDLPADGDQGDFPGGMDFTFNCPVESQSYTITAKDDAGNKVSRTVTVTNTGDTQ
jgi:hypothetical protein